MSWCTIFLDKLAVYFNLPFPKRYLPKYSLLQKMNQYQNNVSSLVPGLLVTALTAKSNISFLYVGFTLRNECSKVLAVTFRYMSWTLANTAMFHSWLQRKSKSDTFILQTQPYSSFTKSWKSFLLRNFFLKIFKLFLTFSCKRLHHCTI